MKPLLPLLLLVAGLLTAWLPGTAAAAAADGEEAAPPRERPGTGLPLPRFVSLRANKVFLRSGPGYNYPIRFVYQRRQLPVQIIDEFDTWRQIRDWQGDVGWVHEAMLTGNRTALVTAGEALLRQSPKDEAAPVARLQHLVIGNLRGCVKGWCELSVSTYDGWLPSSEIWGTDGSDETAPR